MKMFSTFLVIFLYKETIAARKSRLLFYAKCNMLTNDYLKYSLISLWPWLGTSSRVIRRISKERASTVTMARAGQRIGSTSGRAPNWAPEVAFSPFHALSSWRLRLCVDFAGSHVIQIKLISEI